nr:penicillin-binding protein activator [Azospirillum fermentarium]
MVQGAQPIPAPMQTAVPAQQTVKAALLLPLSGSSAAIGQPMVDAAQIALFDMAAEHFELMPRDTKGTPQGAADAARKAIADGASIILGPLYSGDVAAVRPVAQQAGVPVVSFTNDWTQATSGVWVMGFIPADQVVRVADYARSRGVTRYGALAPRGLYGDAVVNALQAAAQRQGAQVVQVERYEPAVADFTAPVQKIAGANAQAVLMAEGGQRIRSLAATAAGNGLNPTQVKFLGTGLWDDPAVAQEPALAGAWFAAPDPNQRADFEARFQSLYGKKPTRLATLAYDATALAAVLARPGGERPYDPAVLTNPTGFAGIDGLFRLRTDGIAERRLAVLEITPQGARVIDPAPTNFDTLGQ